MPRKRIKGQPEMQDHGQRNVEWSIEESMIYEFAWIESEYRQRGDTRQANLVRKLKKELMDNR